MGGNRSLTVNDIEQALFDWAPKDLAMKGDTNGLAAGNRHKAVTHVLTALDISQKTIAEAAALGAELIVAHHPIVWGEGAPWPNSDTDAGNILFSLCGAGLAAITMHTNLDAAQGGINDILAEKIGLTDVFIFDKTDGIGRMGKLPEPYLLHDFAAQCKKALKTCSVYFYAAGRPVENVALCSGGGGFLLEEAVKAGCDTFLSGEIKHSQFLTAQNQSVNVIECGHFATENIIVPAVAEYLAEKFPDLTVTQSTSKTGPYQCL
jgi:dinuclear metal center YbgI/SA1388 family protein